MSESWLVELTDTTLVMTAGPEFELVVVLVGFWATVEHPAHAHTATMTTTTLEARTSLEGISSPRKSPWDRGVASNRQRQGLVRRTSETAGPKAAQDFFAAAGGP